jgi:ribosomal protein S18 acetylase RimI-like enzyme
MTLVKKNISYNDCSFLIELDEFIKNNTIGTTTFRYFSKRPYSVIKNHIYTCMYYDGDKCVGYGHLDKEGENIWLGVLVSDTETGKKIGGKIVDDLIMSTNLEISLSVDVSNNRAIHIYEKKGFIITNTYTTHHTMKLNKV